VINLIKNEQIIDESDLAELNQAQHFELLGIVKLEEKDYFNCKSSNCDEKIYFERQNEIQCKNCLRFFSPNTLKLHKEYLVTFNEKGIFDYLINNVHTLGYAASIDKEENIIKFEKDKKSGIICIMDYCTNTTLFEPAFNDSILRIICDYSIMPIKGIQQDKFFYLGELLTKEIDFAKKLELLIHHEPSKNETELKKIKSYLESPDPTGKKLELFVKGLLNYLQENPELTQNFMIALEKNKNNIFGSAIIRLAGAGRTDITQIPLYPYLLDFYRSDNNYECKSWASNKSLTPKELGSAVLQAQDLNMAGFVAICTGKVSEDNWQRAIKNKNKFRILIIDKYILMRIVNGVNAFKLIYT